LPVIAIEEYLHGVVDGGFDDLRLFMQRQRTCSAPQTKTRQNPN
jgi:hypothetical protein